MVSKSSYETVRILGLQLPEVEEGTMYGKPALKIHGKAFVCMSSHKSAEPDSLVVRADFEQRAELLNADPNVYYITDHYKGYPAVLVRLARVTPDILRDLLGMAYRYVAGEAGPRPKRQKSARAGVTQLGLQYAVGVQSSMTVWEPGAKPWNSQGRPPQLPRRDTQHQPVSVKEVALALPSSAWKDVSWREGTERNLRSRFAALRVRPAGGDNQKAEPSVEEWLLIEWPRGEVEPAKYWLSTLPSHTQLKPLVKMAKHRWIIERDYEELKQELGLGHYEGRGWRGFHHHATLCIAAYGFLIAERNRFFPSARIGNLGLSAPKRPPDFQPRGSRPSRAA